MGQKYERNSGDSTLEINVSTLAPSLYFISIETNLGRYQTKFIKQ
ncbi:MAG: T9SS type A sorting domain-containing protein [Bacteroidia bacterium]|nr:T9SS type A sorting domain-containing protein [Bacteroidia bacterium]MCF8428365.1 T9SS type A sorting domain-containing protein [Bacteroidia bacterium]MCF8447300.1 T9SS type A sorting domain-containing protein [Bacteroidia bacterium]